MKIFGSFLVICVIACGIFYWKKSFPVPGSQIEHSEKLSVEAPKAVLDESDPPSHVAPDAATKVREIDSSKGMSAETVTKVETLSDDALFERVNSLPANANKSQIVEALFKLASNAKDTEKALIVISQYGTMGYTAASVLVDRTAKEKPEQAKLFVSKLLSEFEGISNADVPLRSAICGALGNLFNVDISQDVLTSIENEKDGLKRRYLYDIFTSNKKFPPTFQKNIIAMATKDPDPFIQKMGVVWKKNDRILTSEEMSPEYDKIMKEELK